MKERCDQEQPLVDYLLGKLSPEEEHRFAERYFVDDQLFDHLQQVESELLDRYVRGGLGPEERAGFEQYLANHPEGKYKVALATSLMQLSASERAHSESVLEREAPISWWASLSMSLENQNRVMRWALAASLVIILILAGYIVYQRRQVLQARNETKDTRAAEEALRQKVVEQEAEIARSKANEGKEQRIPQPEQAGPLNPSQSPHEPRTQHTVAFMLFNLPLRGSAETETLQLMPETKVASVTIILDGSERYLRYRVTAQSMSGATVMPSREVSTSSVGGRRILRFTMKPMRLTETTYYLYVTAMNEGQEVPGATRILTFKVVRKA